MIAGLGAGAVASVAAYNVFGHIRQRVAIWKNPWATIDSSGYQICQSMFSIGMGSWFGFGLCQGMKEKIPVIAIVGPTASGKTGLAVSVAERFGGEVISADSMQIYSEL